MIPLDVARATNLWGRLDPDLRARLEAVVTDPTEATWDDAHCIVLDGVTFTTLWQAVIAVDPTFPTSGPATNLSGDRVTGWVRVPDRELLLRALRWVVAVGDVRRARRAVEAEEARDEALERVEANASIDWLMEAERCVILQQRDREFTTDVVWEWLAGRDDVDTHEPRALGAVMRRLAKAGEIGKTGRYEPSRRRECHARPIPVWRRLRGQVTAALDLPAPPR